LTDRPPALGPDGLAQATVRLSTAGPRVTARPAAVRDGGSVATREATVGDDPTEAKGRAQDEDHYLSHDSAPRGYAVARSLWVAPAFILLFVLLCAAVVPALPALTSWYAEVVAMSAGVSEHELLGEAPSLYFRPFLVLLILLLSIFAFGPAREKAKLLALSLGLYAAAVYAVDVVLAAGHETWAFSPFSSNGGIATGIVGLIVIVVSIVARYNLPAGVRVVRSRPASRRTAVTLCVCATVGLAVVATFSLARDRYFDDFEFRFIGGLNSEVVLFLLTVVTFLYAVSAWGRRRKPTAGPALSVAFLVPAYNEAHSLGRTFAALDAAAGNYNGRCVLYFVDNGSKDGTPGFAGRLLSQCRNLEGEVLECPYPGKGCALNFGLAHITEDIVVRIDADTIVQPSLLEKAVPWFWDPSVGGVAGVPLPRDDTPRWLYPLRIIEVIYGVAFLRFAQTSADATMVMPGLFATYRREHLDRLGGFGEGFNGEDADITMRIGRLGYRIITDTTIQVRTEVPRTLMHLREQRQRWARGLFHMASRNLSAIWLRQGARGLWLLPWSLFNGSRRSLMVPLLACALTVELLDPSVLSLQEVSVMAGFIVGLQLFVITALLIAHRNFAVLPFVPVYLLFRVFRAYVAFETILSLCLKDSRTSQATGGGILRRFRAGAQALRPRRA
jgi:cellulose synthase/poly-beta-1,6-N-acetylglucosamine synthase-like glycosyltransferase